MKRRALTFPKGVLKIKKGYNPNSSSIGTVLYSFPLAFAALSALLALCAAIIKGKERKEQ
jgi:hypothetical protein